jgi:hypothetical protein
MKYLIVASILALALVGCKVGGTDVKVDPVASGEIIGFAYTLTQDKLSTQDRKNIETAYTIFSEVANTDPNTLVQTASTGLEQVLLNAVAAKFPDPKDAAIKMATTLVIQSYWSQVDAKYALNIKPPVEQLAIMKQVYIGIQQGLGKPVAPAQAK